MEYRPRASKRWWCSHRMERKSFSFIQRRNCQSQISISHKKAPKSQKPLWFLCLFVANLLAGGTDMTSPLKRSGFAILLWSMTLLGAQSQSVSQGVYTEAQAGRG